MQLVPWRAPPIHERDAPCALASTTRANELEFDAPRRMLLSRSGIAPASEECVRLMDKSWLFLILMLILMMIVAIDVHDRASKSSCCIRHSCSEPSRSCRQVTRASCYNQASGIRCNSPCLAAPTVVVRLGSVEGCRSACQRSR